MQEDSTTQSRASTLPVPLINEPGVVLTSEDLPLAIPRTARPFSHPSSVASSHDDVHTGKTWARSVEDPWLPLILTLDGGGIRGYSSLLIIQRLMKEVAEWENRLEAKEKPMGQRRVFREADLLPCHYFDFMYGTSTGGLIATMLGRLRMAVPTCLDIYREVGNELFGRKKNFVPLATKYKHEPLERAVRHIVQDHCPLHAGHKCSGDCWNPWNLDGHRDGSKPYPEEPFNSRSSDRICQTICLTAIHNKSITQAHLLRTYNHTYDLEVPLFVTRYNEGAEKLRIWQVTRATSAAPFFFKSLVADIDGERTEFKDGGIRENNPSVAAWSEFVSLYGENRDPALLLSIGTGRPNMDKDGFASVWPGPFGRLGLVKKLAETFAVFKNMLLKYTEGELRHESMSNLARGGHTWYKRLNVSRGLETMRLDNWEASVDIDPVTKARHDVPGGRTLRRMEEATDAYLRREADPDLREYAAPKMMLKQIAEKMVRHRRARESSAYLNQERWDNYMGRNLGHHSQHGRDRPTDHVSQVVRLDEQDEDNDVARQGDNSAAGGGAEVLQEGGVKPSDEFATVSGLQSLDMSLELAPVSQSTTGWSSPREGFASTNQSQEFPHPPTANYDPNESIIK